ncbi:hypothetical protein M5K25_019891 [Dendrobium thyrsiflorum]|uniref:Uncharacterized protein n=1 Tax=Dendrobium thyrsiflorum TaxID=117978 RepID=A0ABD0UGL5_DENTH
MVHDQRSRYRLSIQTTLNILLISSVLNGRRKERAKKGCKEENKSRETRVLSPLDSSSTTAGLQPGHRGTPDLYPAIDRLRISARPPIDAGLPPGNRLILLPGHQLTPEFYPASNYYWSLLLVFHKKTAFPTFIACRLRSFRPLWLNNDNDLSDQCHPLTTVLPTSIARQQSFLLLSLVDYGLSDILRRLRSFRPSSLVNGLSDLRCPPTTVLPTYVTRQRSF